MTYLPLYLWNTLTKKEELFSSTIPGYARVYACGPTVYDRAHLGNFRYFIFVDTLVRTLKENGLKTRFIMNITDVGHLTDDADSGEDKIAKRAEKERKTAKDIAEEYTRLFFHDAALLNLLRPDETPRATSYIQEQVAMIKTLEEKGFTYQTRDGVYFDTKKIPGYGKLADLSQVELAEGARIAKNPEKRNPTDFALWKFSPKDKKRDMEWQSPWGVGFPGWHIECSAISRSLLGFPFDIHTGGVDHKTVHHTNEIAQNESFFGKETVRFWMHSEFMSVSGNKMSKSLGNTYTVADLEKAKVSPLAFRYFALSAHYRTPINFTWEAMENAQRSLLHLAYEIRRSCAGKKTSWWKKLFTSPSARYAAWREKFINAINHDLNTPVALSFVWELLKDRTIPPHEKSALIVLCDRVLGLNLERFLNAPEIPKDITALSERREEARRKKAWNEADVLRSQIEKAGFFIEDTEEGPVIIEKGGLL